MAVSFVTAAASGSSADSTSRSVNLTGLQADDVAVAFLETWLGNVTISNLAASGFAQEQTGGSGGATFSSGDSSARNFVLWKRFASGDLTAGAATVSFTLSASRWSTLQVLVFRGCPTTGDPWDTDGSAVTGTYGSIPSIPLSVTDPNGVQLFTVYNDAGGTHTPPTGFTEPTGLDVDCAAAAYKLNGGTAGLTSVSGASVTSSSPAGAWAGALLSDPGTVTAVDVDDVTNLDYWYKADAITGLSDGASLTAWTDSSGNGHTTEQPFGVKPFYETAEINGLPAVRFRTPSDTGDRALRSPAGHDTGARTFFVVIRPDGAATTGNQDIIGADGASIKLSLDEGGKIKMIKVGQAVIIETPVLISDNTVYVITATFTPATGGASTGTAAIWVNGVLRANVVHSQTLSSSTYVYLGGSGIFGGNPFRGYIAELGSYGPSIAEADRAGVAAGLTAKWTGAGPPPAAASLVIPRRPARGLILR